MFLIDQFSAYMAKNQIPLELSPLKDILSQSKLREWLNKEWASVTLPAFAFTAMDGAIKFAGTDNQLFKYQAMVAAVLAIGSTIGRPCDTFKQGTLSALLAIAGAGAGLVHALPVADEGLRQSFERMRSLPQLTPDTMIPARVLCNRSNSHGVPHEVTIDGAKFALTCPKLEK